MALSDAGTWPGSVFIAVSCWESCDLPLCPIVALLHWRYRPHTSRPFKPRIACVGTWQDWLVS